MSPAADRLAAAEVRATSAYRSVCNKADAVLEELAEATDPNAVPIVEIHEEDSLVIVVEDAKRAASRR
jgi:hypothetical protein